MNNSNAFSALPTVVKNLLIMNGVFFLGSMVFDQAPRFFGVYYPDSPFFRVWQIFTYMFMHADLAHIFFNMFALFMFGPVLEQILGSKRFLQFYLITGLGALFLQYGVQAIEIFNATGTIAPGRYVQFNMLEEKVYTYNAAIGQEALGLIGSIYITPMVGASGAIFGLLLAFGYLFPDTKLMLLFFPVPVKAKYFIPVLILIELFLGVSRVAGTSIAHFAHIGGALFGFLLIKFWKIKRPTHWY